MLDKYVDTDVQRISPEAPVPVAKIERRWSALGGAANVARNLASIGAAVTLCGVRANDAPGQELHSLLEQEAIISPAILVKDRPTTCKTRVLSHGQQLLRLDEESSTTLQDEALEKLSTHCDRALAWAEGVILSDYGKGVFSGQNHLNLAAKAINYCNAKKIPLCIDPTGTDWSIYEGAICLTPNTKELAKVLGLDPSDYAGLCHEALKLMQALNFERILLTRGPKGMTLLELNGEVQEIVTEAKEVCDVSGAGDTVIAVLLASVAQGKDWLTAAKIANTAAGIVVGKVGTSTVSLEELLLALSSGSKGLTPALIALRSKLVNLKQLLDKISEWRKHHDRIVFTNGCFDLLHPGHVKLLQEAASLGDKLIVAINSDASVRRLKGPDRPIQSEDARALVMAGMHGVDSVIIFEEDTPLELIKAILPDVLVKGGDYQIEEVVGASEVKAHGGSVHIANLVDGFSTSSIVAAIQD
ncbi:MAG: D-glycero-beta-D-manno-heptose 1-phosphate adenylyltransferase [Desulfovibrionaceae bacterium]|nr:D-glycero-beta-D-manno-heptose 1-phosphate adenylyltransferase [Desulfovibrionaceae bacterium]